MLSRAATTLRLLVGAARHAHHSSTPAQATTPPLEPRGKAALVTGGAAGLGAAVSKALVSAGAKVAVVDVDAAAGSRLVQGLRAAAGDGSALFLHADVTDFARLQDAFEMAKGTFNGLDIVINNAGVGNDVEWQREIDINLKGVVGGTLLGLRLATRGARVLNVASVAALGAFSCAPVYTATKHAVVALTRCYGAAEHTEKTGVSVVAVCPGPCDTTLLENVGRHLPEAWQAEQFYSLVQQFGVSSPEQMAEGVMHVLRDATSGSVWVCHEGRASPVEFPELL
ncbi:15-hydroxyprostaglandin dehydrogenase [NAD(+)]-like isoform X2 [Schistocerca serialis cubense]|uniref:15-hydroxyprostaglandin dehydrogenase [NAD(+)]-like isoform X2 n=1 Tax=Schistocerca serialis cubense TaxID=2023355 RepID=UPI00214DF64D|nr:15-hydroxyprostaglandin dehydrogenase [NAD(+)]-like isoform X2 [Schistocerca serialis cubense]